MAKFSVGALESLDYDFQGIPKDGGKGWCSGKGTIPEPSQKDLEEYQKAVQEVAGANPLEALQRDTELAKKQLHQTLELTAKLCKNQPTVEELEELPPRYKIGFIRWLGGEFSNPEVSSAGIRR